jgi:hypothetical protein
VLGASAVNILLQLSAKAYLFSQFGDEFDLDPQRMGQQKS